MNEIVKPKLEDVKIPLKIQLASLWTSLMFLFIYGDYFGLYIKGALLKMNDGQIGPLGEATPMVLVGVSIMMAIPSLMVFLSIILPPIYSRIFNIIFGIIYAIIMVLTLIGGAALFFTIYAVFEISICLIIAIFAWRWKRV